MEEKKTTTKRKACVRKTKTPAKPKAPEHIGLVKNDSWLEPFEAAIRGRHEHALWKLNQLTRNGKKPLKDLSLIHI